MRNRTRNEKYDTRKGLRAGKRNERPGEPIDYIAYCRKSSEEGTGKQILSLDRQRKWAQREAHSRKHTLTEDLREEMSATEPYRRPVFDEMIKRLKHRKATGIYTWKLDRLARNPEEAGIIMGMLKRREIQHIVTSQREYRPEDNAIISYVDFSLADQYVRDLATNVYDGLHNKAGMGDFPGYAALGYRNTKYAERGSNKILVDPDRFDTVRQAWDLMLTGNRSVLQINKIAQKEWHLTTRATKTRPDNPVSRATWYRIFTNPFYYGSYEYPRGSGRWHSGKHQPMITVGEFDRVQALLGRKGRPRGKRRQHAFTGLIHCGSCPAMVTAEEKIKRQKNGNVHFYTYYHCSRRVERHCPERSIELEGLKKQITDILGTLRISDEFLKWAIIVLAMTDKEEARKLQSIRKSKQKTLAKIKRQLENLSLKFTSPENTNGELFTDTEYLELKHRFNKEEGAIEQDIDRFEEDGIEEVDKQTRETFNLAHSAVAHFSEGDTEAKRDILTRIGSNRRLRDKKLLITLRKPLNTISEKRERVERELSQVRTAETVENKRHPAEIVAKCPILCGVVDDVRTYFLLQRWSEN